MFVSINNTAARVAAMQLSNLDRRMYARVVKKTLSDAAFDVKLKTMPETAQRFMKRKPTFFKANSRAVKAQGVDINTMKSIVGFRPKSGDNSHSVEDLEEQENSGDIDNRSFIALPKARLNNSWGKMQRSKNRMSNVRNNIFDANNANLNRVKNKKEAFTVTAITAGKGAFVIGTDRNSKGNRFVYYINSLKRVGKDTKVNSTAVFVVKGGRKVRPKATHFMQVASLRTARKMGTFFVNNANRMMRTP